MKITIKDFRGLADFEADTAGVLLVAGGNGAGKSSACAAIAAVACGEMLPFEGLTKGTANLLVRDGAVASSCVIYRTDEAGARGIWPECVRQTKGAWRDSSAVAVGLVKPAHLKPAERAGWLISLLEAVPSKARLLEALAAAGVAKEHAERAADLCEQVGYDQALTKVKEGATKAKGRWESVTAERYGEKKAGAWRPKAWRAALEKMTLDELASDAAGADEKLKQLGQKRIIATADHGALEAKVKQIPMLEMSRDKMLVIKDDDIQKQMQAHAAREALGQEPTVHGGMECPCCGAKLKPVDGKLIEVGADEDPEATERLRALIRTADFDKATYDRRVRENEGSLARAQAALDDAYAARAELEKAPQIDATLESEIAAAAAISREQNAALSMKSATLQAAAEHEAVVQLLAIAEHLAPTGLRQVVLGEKLAAFNDGMAATCVVAGWLPVAVDSDMAISYGGRPFGLLSDGEKFRVDCIIQSACATAENAPIVVIDGADILDRAGRNGLFAMLSPASSTVVGMTILRRQDMPDLAAAGLGVSVWVEQGSISAKDAV